MAILDGENDLNGELRCLNDWYLSLKLNLFLDSRYNVLKTYWENCIQINSNIKANLKKTNTTILLFSVSDWMSICINPISQRITDGLYNRKIISSRTSQVRNIEWEQGNVPSPFTHYLRQKRRNWKKMNWRERKIKEKRINGEKIGQN